MWVSQTEADRLYLLPTSMLLSTARRLPTLLRSVHTEAKLAELGITLPPVAAPVANYKSCVRVGNMLFTGAWAVVYLRSLPLRVHYEPR